MQRFRGTHEYKHEARYLLYNSGHKLHNIYKVLKQKKQKMYKDFKTINNILCYYFKTNKKDEYFNEKIKKFDLNTYDTYVKDFNEYVIHYDEFVLLSSWFFDYNTK